MSQRSRTATMLALPFSLLAIAPPPAAAVHGLGEATTADPLGPLLSAVALAAWACSAWLLVVAALMIGGRLPGSLGRAANVMATFVAPLAVRHAVRVAVGVSVVAAALTGPNAWAGNGLPTSPTSGVSAASADTPSLDWPVTGTPRLAAAADPEPRDTPATRTLDGAAVVVVRPGDCLWDIAATALGPGATDRQIAQAWPLWWSVNRAVLGDDPDVIHPGIALQPPPTP